RACSWTGAAAAAGLVRPLRQQPGKPGRGRTGGNPGRRRAPPGGHLQSRRRAGQGRGETVLRAAAAGGDPRRRLRDDLQLQLHAALGALGGGGAGLAGVGPLAASMERVIEGAHPALGALAARGFDRVAYLGSGVLQGLAREAALKLGELSNGAVATCYDSTLGFRHGPKTFVTANTLVAVFVSNDPLTRRYDLDLVDELRADGCAGQVLEITAQPRAAHRDDSLAIPGMETAADIDLLFRFVVAAQMYAFFASRALGL